MTGLMLKGVELKFPVWVRFSEGRYNITSLLFESVTASDRDYEKALNDYKMKLTDEFFISRQYDDLREKVIWALFNPKDLSYKVVPLSFKAGQDFIQINLSLVTFVVNDQVFCCLPAFDRHFLVTDEGEAIVPLVTRFLQGLQREHKNLKGTDIYFPDHDTPYRSFVEILDGCKIYVRPDLGKWQNNAPEGMREINQWLSKRNTMNSVCSDLNSLYPDELDRAFLYDKYVKKVKKYLFQDGSSVALVGPPKSGKTTIVHEALRQYLAKTDTSDAEMNDHIWLLDPGRIISGMSVIGQWERRFEEILEFTQKPSWWINSRKDKILFTNAMTLTELGRSSGQKLNLASILKSYLEAHKAQVIIELTPSQWELLEERDRSLTEYFQVVTVREPDELDLISILVKKRHTLEKKYNLNIRNDAIKEILSLHYGSFSTFALPGACIDRIEKCCREARRRDWTSLTGIRTREIDEGLNPLIPYSGYAHEMLYGQPEATEYLKDTAARIHSKILMPDRPISTGLFIGPTGTGKTYAVKQLAMTLFGDTKRLIRLNMNEFVDSDAVYRLIGDMYRPRGILQTLLHDHYVYVILFDEIEKAHPLVHQMLLQVFGEGRLTTYTGEILNFTNCILIMTSNLGSELAGKSIGLRKDVKDTGQAYEKAIRNFFTPEFINRIDRLICFRHLPLNEIQHITVSLIRTLTRREGILRRKLAFSISENVYMNLAREGHDEEMGARAVRRHIEKELIVDLSKKLSALPPDECCIVHIFHRDGKLVTRDFPLLPVWDNKLLYEKNDGPYPVDDQYIREVDDKVQQYIKQLEDLIYGHPHETDLVSAVKHDHPLAVLISFLENLRNFRESYSDTLWESEHRQMAMISVIRNRLKPDKARIGEPHATKHQKKLWQDFLHAVDAYNFLVEMTKESEHRLTLSDSWLRNFQQYQSFLRYFMQKTAEQQFDHFIIGMRSIKNHLELTERGTGTGWNTVREFYDQELLRYYCSFVQEFGFFAGEVIFQAFPGRRFRETGGRLYAFIEIRGFGLYELFRNEVGFHLLTHKKSCHFPNEVFLKKIPAKTDAKSVAEKIISETLKKDQMTESGQLGAEKLYRTLNLLRTYNNNGYHRYSFDLRTALYETSNYLSDEYLKMIFYKYLPESFRKQ